MFITSLSKYRILDVPFRHRFVSDKYDDGIIADVKEVPGWNPKQLAFVVRLAPVMKQVGVSESI